MNEDVHTPLLANIRSQQHNSNDPYGHGQYLATCQLSQCTPCADALIRLQLGHENLVIQPDCGRDFGNLDMRALADFLEEGDGQRLARFTALDLSQCTLGPSGIMLVGQLLSNPHCRLEEVTLSSQDVGPEAARVLVDGIKRCHALRVLRLHSCRLRDEGARAFIDLLSKGRGGHGLQDLDVQNNFITYQPCRILSELASEQAVVLHLEGNRVLDEIFNAISHGTGFAGAIVGSVFLGLRALKKPPYFTYGILPYCIALTLLFLASTLYHSFHALGRTVNRIFQIIDHSGIYLLIAGTYTPILVILLHDMWYSLVFLGCIWGVAGAGMLFTVTYTGRCKIHIENALYLLMGWSCIVFIGDALERLGPEGSTLLITGGVLYSVGVIWFVKDGETCGIPDHLIWHVYVLAACICHYLCILWYVVG